ncbi:MAG: phosphoribosylanthranilate isomerase [Lachnospiraceae bacterium]|nr:phosphoribosylanthranilate isomerase [Lachnospiraceae bacterium]
MPKIKICGLSRDIDADFANEVKPDYVGFIIGVPWSKRNIDGVTAHRLREKIDNDIPAVGVFIDYQVESVAKLVLDGSINIVQLHGHEDESYIADLRSLVPNVEIWKAFVITSDYDIMCAEQSSADKVLLDSGAGCGKTFDWSIVKNIKRDFILAGGLTPQNIPLAVKQVNPWAIDLSSGVETDEFKDIKKMSDAVKAARLSR